MKPYYEQDGITIFHGDCRELLPDLDDSLGVVTDPPYGISYRHGARAGGVRFGMDGVSIAGDDQPFDPSPLLRFKGGLVLWGANHYASRLPDSRGWLVWDKRDGGPEMDQSDVELAWTNVLTVARKFTRRWSGAVRGSREQAEGRLHTNQKPVALMGWCLSFLGHPGAIVDPFCGSGPTLVAAKDGGRAAIGIEIEERYCEIAARRLDQGVLELGA